MQTLILARHGESEYSARGLVNGDASVDVGLTEKGEEQARALGRALQAAKLDLCVTTELRRTRRTADLALAVRALVTECYKGLRDVPVETWPDLNDPRAGSFEGGSLADYRGWAWSTGSAEPVPGGGESRLEVVSRCARAYRELHERPEPVILAVLHALPIAYLLGALGGAAPAARMSRPVEYARAYFVEPDALLGAVEVLEAWCAAPGW